MKTLSLIFVALFCFSCNYQSSKKSLGRSSSQRYLRALQNRKAFIDRIPTKDTNGLMVFVKMNNKNELLRILKGSFPEDSIECTYNVLTEKGKVIMIMTSPYSESGDWDMECTHYFKADGHTFAFEKQANAFALPDDGVAYETTIDYFDPQFKCIKHIYKLVDKNGKGLDKSYAFDRGSFNDKIYSTSGECLSAYHIKL